MTNSIVGFLQDSDRDLMMAQYSDGAYTIAVARGAEIVTQNIATRLSLTKGRAWYARSSGIDHERIREYIARDRDGERKEIVRQIYERTILQTDGVVGFDGAGVTFDGMRPIISCVIIDCDNSIFRGTIANDLPI